MVAARVAPTHTSSYGFSVNEEKQRPEQKVKGGMLEPKAEADRTLYPLLFVEVAHNQPLGESRNPYSACTSVR
jgi:hypothetical protein